MDSFFSITVREKTRKSDQSWIKTVLKTGTMGDKLSAHSIQVQDSAIHNLDSVDALLASVKLSKKRECMLAIGLSYFLYPLL